jgi:hypothetical protein
MAAHLDPTEARARRVILQLEVDLVEIRVEQVHHEPERAAFARGPDPARCRSSLTDTLHTEAPQRSGGSVCSIQFGSSSAPSHSHSICPFRLSLIEGIESMTWHLCRRENEAAGLLLACCCSAGVWQCGRPVRSPCLV